MLRTIALMAATCIGLSGLGLSGAVAQSFPTHPIKLLVPYAAGGPLDLTARVVGEHLAATLGQPVIIENVSGGSGTIATARVAKATPDGYLLIVHQPALAANVTLFPALPFDAEKELASVGLLNNSPMVLTASNAIKAKTMAEVVAWMKQNDGKIKFAHAGVGSLSHLCAALFSQLAGVKATMIPYRGGTPAITDTMAGHTDLYCSSAQLAIEQVKAGNVVGFGVTSKERMSLIPNVPTTAEAGFPKLDVLFWNAIYAPGGMPKPLLEKLNAAVKSALADPGVQKKFEAVGVTVYPENQRDPGTAETLLREEIKRWGEVIRANKIEATP